MEKKRDEKEKGRREEVLIWAEKLRDWLKADKTRTIWPT